MITKAIFERVLHLSGKPREVGHDYYIEGSDRKIYSFCLGADGSVWDTTMGTAPSSYEDIKIARESKHYLGMYL